MSTSSTQQKRLVAADLQAEARQAVADAETEAAEAGRRLRAARRALEAAGADLREAQRRVRVARFMMSVFEPRPPS